ncbi:DUF2490 domain-containing protein [Flavobacterium agricola]|uniref:DUF2490 domain-containing protein n=1 Tax=Flavobacterium agricola TaxID=2870839 RepID=A0ABY6LZI7_9FLAO|nr:DUF2490 domain-containing protein [Flavobacterium agricola]UYW01427.1 DUF2490 domain-containing protein [Flavobacterium agricola]
MQKSNYFIWFGLCALLQFQLLFAQDKYNMWYQYLLQAKIHNKSNFTALTQYRSYDLAFDNRVFLVDGYVDYEWKQATKPALGFLYLHISPYKDENTKKIKQEFRPFQQITYNHNFNRISLAHRFRFEERLLSNPSIFILRTRYLLSIRVPFHTFRDKEIWYGIFKNEIRLNLKKNEFFDSDRILVGIGCKFSKNTAIEVAYINQIEKKDLNHFAFLGFRNQFDWRKSK